MNKLMKSRTMRWVEYVARVGGGEEKCIQGFGGKPAEKRTLGRPRRGWEMVLKWFLKK